MGWTRQVAEGVAAVIGDDTDATYLPTGVYPLDGDLIPVFIGPGTPADPDTLVVVTGYVVSEDTLGNVVMGVQVRTRGPVDDPVRASDLDDDIRDALHGRQNVPAGPAELAILWRQSRADLGQDDVGRFEVTSNYYAHTGRTARFATD